ncbi:ASCH domain-containing protein [Micrococcus terreus]|uniref:ASCH domain-containing protein n=1 Tax=Micrococcus terreus TaxID=574650 RepID=UPI00254FF207|nr:ASCH domain-containing protein [Micrococcus terreus]MDK7702057.1 ASCH domain-containing protein [Micrococcus terreus]WOO98704.1 ASCH domain-containing protein [Micrococcus terreus]
MTKLPREEFASAGPLRDALVAAILDGTKTSTTSLHADYASEGETLPQAGDRGAVVDSEDQVVAVIETTAVDVVRLAEVPLEHARAEGEGHRTVAEWRRDHERFWAECGVAVDDDTLVVLQAFRVVEILQGDTADLTRRRYRRRAQEYTDQLGAMDAVAEPDRVLVERWAQTVQGRILDAGCGPGHWTGHLAGLGHDVVGMDPVEEFVAHARLAHPGVAFRVGSFEDLPGREEYGGILSWYSLIHLDPSEVRQTLARFRDTVPYGGSVLLGFFTADELEPFDHLVAPAWVWPVEQMIELLEAHEFEVLHQERRQDPGVRREHAVVVAVHRRTRGFHASGPRRLRMFNEYGVDWPFWDDDGPMDVDDLPLPEELTSRVLRWAAGFNDEFDWDRGWPSAAQRDAHVAEGHQLFREVQAALPAHLTVELDLWETIVAPPGSVSPPRGR